MVTVPMFVRGMVSRSVLAALPLLLASCGDGAGTSASQADENAFIQMSLQATCANLKNKLYEVDQVLVLSDRAGSCPDASFSQVLYGLTPSEVLCRNQDSIAGPVKRCDVAAYQSMFDTMTANLAKPDLGLGPTHSIKVLLN